MDFRGTQSASPGASNTTGDRVIYSERQPVPWWWWVIAAITVALLTGQMAHNRNAYFLWIPLVLFTALAVWILLKLGSTTITVTEDADGIRWLNAGDASLPEDLVVRCLAVPKSAKSAAMGRQLDPTAYLATHDWVPEMAMFVLADDPDSPVPYWLVSSRNPRQLIEAFVPHLAASNASPS